MAFDRIQTDRPVKFLGFQVSETPKNRGGNPKFGPGFTNGNPESATETQFQGMDFRKKTQIFFVILHTGLSVCY